MMFATTPKSRREIGNDRRYNRVVGWLVPVAVLSILALSRNQLNLNAFMIQLKNAEIVQQDVVQTNAPANSAELATDLDKANSDADIRLVTPSPTSSPSYTPAYILASHSHESIDQTVEVTIAGDYPSRDELYSIFNLTIEKGAIGYIFNFFLFLLVLCIINHYQNLSHHHRNTMEQLESGLQRLTILGSVLSIYIIQTWMVRGKRQEGHC